MRYRIYITEEFFGGYTWALAYGPRDREAARGWAETEIIARAEAEEVAEIMWGPKPVQMRMF